MDICFDFSSFLMDHYVINDSMWTKTKRLQEQFETKTQTHCPDLCKILVKICEKFLANEQQSTHQRQEKWLLVLGLQVDIFRRFFFFFTFRLGLSLISEMTTPYTHTNLHVRLIWWNWMGLLKWINFTCFHGPALFSLRFYLMLLVPLNTFYY